MTRLLWDAFAFISITCGCAWIIGFAQAIAQGAGQ